MNKATLQKKKRIQAKGAKASSAPDSPALFARRLCISAGITAAIGLGLLLLGALGAYFFPNPSTVILPIGIAASAFTALFGGMVSSRIIGKNALLCGLSNGCVLLSVMLLLSLCMIEYSSHYASLTSFLLHLGFMLFSILGAELGFFHTKKHRPKKHVHKRSK